MKGNIFFKLVFLIVAMMAMAGNALAQVDQVSRDHTALTANNTTPVPMELTANTLGEIGSDCPATTSRFETYVTFSLGEDNYYTESDDELAGIRVNISALGVADAVLFEALDVELSLNRLEPLKSYHFEFTGSQAADVRKVVVTPIANSYQVSTEVDASKVSLTALYESVAEVDAAQAVLSLTSMGALSGTFEHTFSWSVVSAQYNCLEVPSYQIQIMRIYGATTLAGLTEKDWKEATNIFSESPETNLLISIAEGTGNYVWRVRPIGSLLGATKYALSNPANWDDNFWVADEFTFLQPDEDKNFIYSRTFTEKGRVSEQLGFANGLGQVAQQQVKIHGQTDQIVATQTLQDFVGRNALSTLPVPLQNTSQFGYKDKLLTKDGTNLITKSDFDTDPQSVVNAQVDGGYYSGNITGVASAEGFPYTRTLFANDGTSRVTEQSGVGATHALKADVNDSHTTRTYYSSVEEAELLTIFGQEAPDASNVHKIITYDANKVASITYQDKAGMVIATALDAGSSGLGLDELPSQATSAKQFFVNIDSKDERQTVYQSSSKKPLFFTSETDIIINYSLRPTTVLEICKQLCRSCDYTIEFILHNQDNPGVPSITMGTLKIDPVYDLKLDPVDPFNPGPGFDALPGPFVLEAEVEGEEVKSTLSGGVNYILEKRISTKRVGDGQTDSFLQQDLAQLDTKYSNAFTDALSAIFNPADPVVDQRSITSDLLLNTPEQLYTDLKAAGFTLDEASGQYMVPIEVTDINNTVVCTEYILVPYYDYCEPAVELTPDANCKVDGFTWEGYFKDYWDKEGEDFGTLVSGKLAYAYFIDEYQKSIETELAKTQNRAVNEAQYTFYYAPGELDQMIDNLRIHNSDRLSCEDIWEVWRNEVVTFKLYDDYANDGALNNNYTGTGVIDESGPELPVFKNNLVDRFLKALQAFLDEQRADSETDICLGNLYLKRDLLYGKIGTTEYPTGTTYPDLKLQAHRLVYLNTDEEDRAIAASQASGEPKKPTRIDALRGLAQLSASAVVTFSDFNQLSDCNKYKLYQMSAGFDALQRAGEDQQAARDGVVSSCGELCEGRYEEFKQAVVNQLMLRNSAHIIEKHVVSENTALQTYVAIYDESANLSAFDYSADELEAMVQAVVDNCKARYCNPDLVAGGIEGAAYAAIVEKVFNYNFELDLKMSGESCNLAEWDVINGDEVINNDNKQLWTVQSEGTTCFETKYTSSVFDKSGNIYAVLQPVKDHHSYTLNNGTNINDNTGAGRFAVVKYDPSGTYLWHKEYYFLVNDGATIAPATQTTGNSLPQSSQSLIFDRQAVTLQLDSQGGVSFNVGVYTNISLLGLGTNTWSLRDGAVEALNFSKTDPPVLGICSDYYAYNKLSVALSATGTTQWVLRFDESLAPFTSFNTRDANGDSYVLLEGALDNFKVGKISSGSANIWVSDELSFDKINAADYISYANKEYHVDGVGNLYLLQHATYFGNNTNIKIKENGVMRTIGTMTDGLPYALITKFDANGKFQWIYVKQTDATSTSALPKDGYVVLAEKLSNGIYISKVYSDANVQGQLLAGAPDFNLFSLMELPDNQVLIYSQQTYGNSVGATTVSLDDYSFASGVDLEGSLGLNISDAYLNQANRQSYVGTTFSQSFVSGESYQEGGFLAMEPATAVPTSLRPLVYDPDMSAGILNPSYMFTGGIDVDAYNAVLDPLKQQQINAEATASNPANTVSDADEYSALKALFDATNPTGTEWTDQTNWPSAGNWANPATVVAADFAGFYGVTVENGDIVAINLEGNGLSGALPAALGDLTKLRTLNLSDNALTGSVPAATGQMTSLVRLDLSKNQLTDVLTGLGSLANLEYLSLSYNQLTAIPTDISLISGLKFLQWAGNDLSNGLPDLSGITGLEYLNLTTTDLTGNMPTWISSLTSLKVLLLNNNGLTGDIPTTFSSLNQLVLLGLNDNELTGGLGNVSTATGMALLDLGDNELSTEVPLSVTSLASLANLYVHGNLMDYGDFTHFQTSQMTVYQYYPQKTVVTGTAASSPAYTEGVMGSALTLSFVPQTGLGANTYQWQKFSQLSAQWVDVSSQTSTATGYAITAVSLADYGTYRVRLGNSNFPLLTLFSSEYVIGKGNSLNSSKLVDPVICFRWTTPRESAIELPTDPDFLFNPIFAPTCESIDMDEIRESIEGQRQALILSKQAEFEMAYQQRCLDPDSFDEDYNLVYSVGIHHYTLYYHDRAGNLINTVPPEGVVRLDVGTSSQLQAAKNLLPAHGFKTSYQYNSQGQLVAQQTPDAGNTDFIYNDIGQLRFSQNARQAIDGTYSYTHYDALARIIEVGLAVGGFNTTARANRNELTWPTGGTEVTHTVYNTPYDTPANPKLPAGYSQSSFLRNRISYTYIDSDGSEATLDDRVITIYSYDPHGNVEWLVQDVPGLGQKTIDYTYDLLSGNVLQVAYNQGNRDEFYHRYEYDQDSRIKQVETSVNGVVWDRDASYDYYAHGPLRQTIIGEDKVQQQDYLYTIQGWLKAINDPASPIGPQTTTTRDAFAMVLNYYSGDYTHSSGTVGKLAAATDRDLYNGNISAWENANQNKTGVWTRSGMQYTYDALNRIKTSTFNVHRLDAGLNIDRFYTRKAFATDYTFDGNGNLLTLNRDDFDGERMDELDYDMEVGKNRLASVVDLSSMAPEKHPDDIEGTNSYVYDAIGNLITDVGSGVNIDWTIYGKVRATSKVTQPAVGTGFLYDAAGNRVVKKSTDQNGRETTDYYIRDASGNVMAIYKAEGADHLSLQELPVYGSDRLGMYKPGLNLSAGAIPLPTDNPATYRIITGNEELSAYGNIAKYYLTENASIKLKPGFDTNSNELDITFADIPQPNVSRRRLDAKLYELKDHLGNIRATVSDKKQVAPEGEAGYMPSIVSSMDYYPYGMDRTPVVWEPVEYLATFETDNEAEEIAGFQDRSQAVLSNVDLYNHTPDTQERDATNTQLLTGQSGNIFGISKFLPIQAGDKVSMEVYGLYTTTATANPYDFSANLVGNLLSQLPLTAGELQAAGLSTSISGEFTNMGRAGLSNADGVSAYLNYLLLDENFSLVSAGYQMLPDNADLTHQQLAMELVPEQDGYVYIYLTNESQQLTDVYFDDFKITHEVLIKDPQLEVYRYGFNGMEKNNNGEFGANSYTTHFRQYDPRIGRWLSIDPMVDQFPWQSPYVGMDNNPIALSDPNGDAAGCGTCPNDPKEGQIHTYQYRTGTSSGGGATSLVTVNLAYHAGSEGRDAGWYSTDNYGRMMYNAGVNEGVLRDTKTKFTNTPPVAGVPFPEFLTDGREWSNEVLGWLNAYDQGVDAGIKMSHDRRTGRITRSNIDFDVALTIASLGTYQIAKVGSGYLRSRIATRSANYLNFASKERTKHILAGDGLFSSSGGHHWFGSPRAFYNGITGKKSMFPITWSKAKSMNALTEVAFNNRWINQTGRQGSFFTRNGTPAKFKAQGFYEGREFRVIIQGGDYVTGFPIKK